MKIKILLLAAFCLTLSSTLWAQEIDQTRMERDLKITEDIIASLFKSESEDGHFHSARPKATYVEGFGVMVNLNSSGSFYSSNFGDFDFHFDGLNERILIELDELEDMNINVEQIVRQEQRVARQAEEIARQAEMIAREQEAQHREMELHARELEREAREMEREAREMELEAREHQRERERDREREKDEVEVKKQKIKNKKKDKVVIIDGNPDSNYSYSYSYSYGDDREQDEEDCEAQQEVTRELYRNVMTTFFTDYADLIGQLKDNEKIILTGNLSSQVHQWNSGQVNSKLTGQVLRKNIADFRSNKVSKEKFIETIEFTETDNSTKKSADLELVSSIFERLYKSDLATTYYSSGKISYQRLDNFGVIYKMKTYSSISSGRDRYRVVTQKASNLSREERDKMVDGMYPAFLQELKGNILDYGKTIKSLKSGEMVLFKVDLTECNDCNMPGQIEISIPFQTLSDYNSGKLNREKGMAAFKVKEN